jgi:hypothetical protein
MQPIVSEEGVKVPEAVEAIPEEAITNQRAVVVEEKSGLDTAKNPFPESVKTEVKGDLVAAKDFIQEVIKIDLKKEEVLPEKAETTKPEETKAEISAIVREMPAVKEMSVNVSSGEKALDVLGQVSDTKISAPAETISKVGNEIIERLMVVQSVNAAKQEVVIVFKENILPETQVSIVREKSELSLVFTTVNVQSLEFLTAGQDGLRNFLLDQLKDITTIHIKSEGKESGDLGEKNPQKRQQNQQSEKENDENKPQK